MLLAALRPLGHRDSGMGVIFALLHWSNPGASWFSAANTAGFGILFGYAYLRSRDLWLPMGLHFGWNFTLPLFGVNVSGLRMKVTGYEMSWTAGSSVEWRRIWPGSQHSDFRGDRRCCFSTSAKFRFAGRFPR